MYYKYVLLNIFPFSSFNPNNNYSSKIKINLNKVIPNENISHFSGLYYLISIDNPLNIYFISGDI